jgi:hypothetical protein
MRKTKKTGKCIYCGEDKKLSEEHYLPIGLGKFVGVEKLKDRICEDCNTGFSNNKKGSDLDGEFCKTGMVGALRELRGIEGRKHHTKHDPFWDKYKNLPLAILHDTKTKIRLESGGRKDFSITRMRQIIIYTSEGQTYQIPISDDKINNKDHLKETLDLELRRFNFSKVKTIMYYGDQDEFQKVKMCINELQLFRYAKETWTEPTGKDELLDVTLIVQITENHMRAVAKILFHYFLKQFPRFRGDEPEFDEIRKFIKTGENIESASDIDRFARLSPYPMSMSQRLGSCNRASEHQQIPSWTVFCSFSSGENSKSPCLQRNS